MQYPFVMNLMWSVLEHLAQDLVRWPNRYQTEADFQAEFCRRLAATLEATGTDTYDCIWSDKHGRERRSVFSIMGCQHGVRSRCDQAIRYPDIVLYAPLDDPRDVKVDAWSWDILCAIEIKHRHKTSVNHPDVAKLEHLIRAGNANFGLWINIERSADRAAHGATYHSLSKQCGLEKGRLWIAQIVAPDDDASPLHKLAQGRA